MIGKQLSRWTLTWFAAAILALVLALGLAAFGPMGPGAWSGGVALAAVHLFAVGWLCQMMLGALIQFVPVISARPQIWPGLSLPALVMTSAGALMLAGGFLSLDGWTAAGGLLVAGPLTLGAAFVLVALSLIPTLLIRPAAAAPGAGTPASASRRPAMPAPSPVAQGGAIPGRTASGFAISSPTASGAATPIPDPGVPAPSDPGYAAFPVSALPARAAPDAAVSIPVAPDPGAPASAGHNHTATQAAALPPRTPPSSAAANPFPSGLPASGSGIAVPADPDPSVQASAGPAPAATPASALSPRAASEGAAIPGVPGIGARASGGPASAPAAQTASVSAFSSRTAPPIPSPPAPGAAPVPQEVRLILLGFLGLLALWGTGTAMALALAGYGGLAGLLPEGLGLHILLGAGGWLSLAAFGVSYKLFAMFLLSPEQGGRLRRAVTLAAACALAAVLVMTGAVALTGTGPAGLGIAVALAPAVTAALFLAETRRIWRLRRRPKPEVNMVWSRAALAFLGLAAGLAGPAFLWGGAWAEAAVFAALAGWLSTLTLAQMVKIVSFLTWIQIFSPQIGRRPVPMVHQLTDAAAAARWLGLWTAGALTGTVALLAGFAPGFRGAAVLLLAAALGLAREVVAIRRLHHLAAPERPGPLPPLFLPLPSRRSDHDQPRPAGT